jgi:hypothetical protein
VQRARREGVHALSAWRVYAGNFHAGDNLNAERYKLSMATSDCRRERGALILLHFYLLHFYLLQGKKKQLHLEGSNYTLKRAITTYAYDAFHFRPLTHKGICITATRVIYTPLLKSYKDKGRNSTNPPIRRSARILRESYQLYGLLVYYKTVEMTHHMYVV